MIEAYTLLYRLLPYHSVAVYDGKYVELAQTFMLYQKDDVPMWFGFFITKDGRFGSARLYVYDALFDWATAHKDKLLEIQKLIDSGDYSGASQRITEILADIEDARELLLALSAIDRGRKGNVKVVVGDVSSLGSKKD